MKKLFVFVQYLLPQHLISRLIGWIARSQFGPLKKLLIFLFIRLYDVDLDEAEQPDPAAYPSFNALFTRQLRHGARRVATSPDEIVSPVDGTVSASGNIDETRLLQAKDRHFTVAQLLAESGSAADAYKNGRFATIYLAPHNYHRIHTPLAGRLHKMTYVPGRLFSVSPATTQAVSHLFARNERVVFHFDCDCGPVALVMVGALNVGSIETVHEGIVAPGGKEMRHWHYDKPLVFDIGQELARFNLGSTVVLLFAEQGPKLTSQLQPATQVQVGEIIARIQPIESR